MARISDTTLSSYFLTLIARDILSANNQEKYSKNPLVKVFYTLGNHISRIVIFTDDDTPLSIKALNISPLQLVTLKAAIKIVADDGKSISPTEKNRIQRDLENFFLNL